MQNLSWVTTPLGKVKWSGKRGWSPKEEYFFSYQVCAGQGLVIT